MPKTRKKPQRILRCDPLAHAANAGKGRALRAVLVAWREAAHWVQQEQWTLFFGSGAFDKQHRSMWEPAMATTAGAANRLQMIRYQVVGILESFVANRAKDFARTVQRSSLASALKHELHTVNRRSAWFSPDPVPMKDGGVVSPEARRLARQIMRRVLGQHRRPSMRHINAVLDARAVKLRDAESSKAYPLWVTLPTMVPKRTIQVPLKTHAHFVARKGKCRPTIQLNEDRDGRLTLGVLTDVTEAFKELQATYTPRTEELALDWGLRTLFGTDQGDLLGRGFLQRLRSYDARITRLAAYRASRGLRTRSPRYDREVARLRGFLRETIGRVLNRVITTHAPQRLVVERLWFRRPELSKRLNRLVTNAGRAIVATTLKDLQERFGVEVVEVNAAYSSQECCECGYVDRNNRRGDRFRCDFCGTTRHADVNSPRTLRTRRSRPAVGAVGLTKAATLRALVAEHLRRHPERTTEGRWGTSRDPRRSNPYFSGAIGGVTANGRRRTRRMPGASTP